MGVWVANTRLSSMVGENMSAQDVYVRRTARIATVMKWTAVAVLVSSLALISWSWWSVADARAQSAAADDMWLDARIANSEATQAQQEATDTLANATKMLDAAGVALRAAKTRTDLAFEFGCDDFYTEACLRERVDSKTNEDRASTRQDNAGAAVPEAQTQLDVTDEAASAASNKEFYALARASAWEGTKDSRTTTAAWLSVGGGLAVAVLAVLALISSSSALKARATFVPESKST